MQANFRKALTSRAAAPGGTAMIMVHAYYYFGKFKKKRTYSALWNRK